MSPALFTLSHTCIYLKPDSLDSYTFTEDSEVISKLELFEGYVSFLSLFHLKYSPLMPL